MSKNNGQTPSNSETPTQGTSSRPTSFHRPDLLKVLNKNPKYRYRWVIFEHIRQSGGIHPNGWRLVTSLSGAEEEIIKEHALEGIKFIDGCVRRYEMALAFMPVAEWQQLKASKDEDAKNAVAKGRKPTKGLDYHEYKRERI